MNSRLLEPQLSVGPGIGFERSVDLEDLRNLPSATMCIT